jgi:phosphonopyruvate decarboxylase
MISADDFCACLERHGYTFFTGVPCSYFQGPIELATNGERLRYVAAANEGAALGVAAGAALAGARPVVMLQSSGFGNLVNPLTSLSMVYGIPALVFISLRAHPDGYGDEPQHRVMGASLERLLGVLGLPVEPLPEDAAGFERLLDDADTRFADGRSTVVLVARGSIGTCPVGMGAADEPPLSRAEAVACVVEELPADAVTVSTTGLISRELFAARDLASNFYMQGSMGHAAAIGLGVALERADRPVVVVDGDGAVLMHMGTLSTIGFYAPANLVHVVIDNEAYESTGSQATTTSRTRLEEVALACGYRRAWRCTRAAEVRDALRAAAAGGGPALVLVKVNRSAASEPPRVTTTYAPADTTRRVSESLSGIPEGT